MYQTFESWQPLVQPPSSWTIASFCTCVHLRAQSLVMTFSCSQVSGFPEHVALQAAPLSGWTDLPRLPFGNLCLRRAGLIFSRNGFALVRTFHDFPGASARTRNLAVLRSFFATCELMSISPESIRDNVLSAFCGAGDQSQHRQPCLLGSQNRSVSDCLFWPFGFRNIRLKQ